MSDKILVSDSWLCQNRRQNVFNRGPYVCAGGLDIPKFSKTPLIYSVSYFNLEGLGALFGGAKPTKVPGGDGTGLCKDSFRWTVLLIRVFENMFRAGASTCLYFRGGQARSQVSRFGGEKYTLGGKYFFLLHV